MQTAYALSASVRAYWVACAISSLLAVAHFWVVVVVVV